MEFVMLLDKLEQLVKAVQIVRFEQTVVNCSLIMYKDNSITVNKSINNTNGVI